MKDNITSQEDVSKRLGFSPFTHYYWKGFSNKRDRHKSRKEIHQPYLHIKYINKIK